METSHLLKYGLDQRAEQLSRNRTAGKRSPLPPARTYERVYDSAADRNLGQGARRSHKGRKTLNEGNVSAQLKHTAVAVTGYPIEV